ncbi:hypothetical protein [Inovirus D_HF1_11]|nr:hypothetical protein [Inovirus D_HF1_11]DAI06849.1 MAG TPA: hypothetical protein [Inoviridae sp.]
MQYKTRRYLLTSIFVLCIFAYMNTMPKMHA